MFWGMISVAPDAIPTRRISSDFGIEMRCDHFPIQFPCLNLAFDYGLAWLAQGQAHGCVCVCVCVHACALTKAFGFVCSRIV